MKGTFAPLAQKGRETKREGEVEREREKEEGRGRREKESWQLLGACGVGPFKARSPDARRRSRPSRPSPTRSLDPTNVATGVLRVFPLRRRPQHLLEKSTNRVATASMKSHPPRISPFLFCLISFFLYFSCILFILILPSRRGFGEHVVARDTYVRFYQYRLTLISVQFFFFSSFFNFYN